MYIPYKVPVEVLRNVQTAGAGYLILRPSVGRRGNLSAGTIFSSNSVYMLVAVNYVNNFMTPKLKALTTQLPLSYMPKMSGFAVPLL